MGYESFLKKEMLSAFGCTEPIAIAFGAARVAALLDDEISHIEVICSANIIKNVKSVIIPNSGGQKSIEVACALGACTKNYQAELEVLESVTDEDIKKAAELVNKISVSLKAGVANLYIQIIAKSINEKVAEIIIENDHSNIVYLRLDNNIIIDNKNQSKNQDEESCELVFDEIYDWCKNGNISGIIPLLKNQIKLNIAIAEEGLKNNYGSNIGKIYLAQNTKQSRIIAHAAAGSDARMSGCSMPVVINSGSGNQGIAVSVPVVLHARDINASEDELYRALAFANLCGFYLKSGVGKLSAYCGVVSAGSSAMCGIAMLDKQPKEIIEQTLINSLATTSGMICDGAKPSCAAKIATSLNTAYIGYEQAKRGDSFNFNDGIIKDDLKSTIDAISTVAKEGMKETDIVILQEMIRKE